MPLPVKNFHNSFSAIHSNVKLAKFRTQLLVLGALSRFALRGRINKL